MKKLLLSSVCLLIFATSVLIVQMSCSKTSAQMRPGDNPQAGKILFGRHVSGNYEIWSADYDGSNASAIPISLPPDVYLVGNVDTKGVKVSPDGQKLFFIAAKIVNNYQQASVYSCNVDGTNAQLVVQGNGGATADILEVYQAY
jgi:hypothetical protein